MRIGVYGILTEPKLGYVELAKIMVEAGVKMIQLRMKRDSREVLHVAQALRPIIPARVSFIINDEPHIARQVQADGVHLGQDDMSYEEAREILGEAAVIGLSTHTVEQCRTACETGADYIGIGPVFPTPTKAIPDPALGLKGMAEMLAVATRPAVVLGSIDLGNVTEVVDHGAKNICAVRAVNQAEDPAQVIKTMQGVIDKRWPAPRYAPWLS